MTAALDPLIAEKAWRGSTTLRDRAHRAAGHWRCPTPVVPYVTGVLADPRCSDSECLGIFHRVYAEADNRRRERVDEQRLRSRGAYARRLVDSQVADLERAARVARGLPAKPTRDDGPARRINAAIDASAGDPITAQWRRALFRLARAYVCRLERTSAEWPLDMWAVEKSTVDAVPRVIGSTAARHEIAGDLEAVLEAAARAAGAGFVHDLYHRLLRVPAQAVADETLTQVPAALPDPDDVIVVNDVVRGLVDRVNQGLDPEQAWVETVIDLTGQPPRARLADLLDDLVHPDTGVPLQRLLHPVATPWAAVRARRAR
jgi:hypothetical protein